MNVELETKQKQKQKQKHATIPVFVPHFACKNDCVFCDQRKISGETSPPHDLYAYLENAAEGLSERFTTADIAFFGGSFTGIEKNLMRFYLETAQKVRKKFKNITGLRLSTRPDYINEKILEILNEYNVTTVEIGAQSMCDEVLFASKRGHNSADIIAAAEAVKNRGISLVLQSMTGLPQSTKEKEIETAEKICKLKPTAVRIYPCVVLAGTELEKMMKSGEYLPQTVEEAVEICVELSKIYHKNDIEILRIGLHSSDLTKDGKYCENIVGGAFHPAFGEMVESEIFYQEIRRRILDGTIKKDDKINAFAISVEGRELSKAIGQKRKNIIRLEEEFNAKFTIKPIKC